MNPSAKCLSENHPDAPVILIVRTEGREAADVAACRAAGWQPVPFSPQKIVPQTAALNELPTQYAAADAVFWVSPGAVQTGMAALPAELYRDKPNIAVGRATAEALHAAGCRQVIAPESGQDSEAVLQLNFWQQQPIGSKLLIISGEGGRNLLATALTARGWQVARAAIYRREPQILDWALYQNAQPQAVWITSAELVRLLFAQVPSELVQNLQSLLYLVHHSKIAEALYQVGATRIQVVDRLDKDFLKSLHGANTDERRQSNKQHTARRNG